MPSEPTGSEDDTNSGDLPSSSGESFADLDSLKNELSEGESAPSDSDTVRMTFHVDEETAERLRNAVYWTATPVTLSGTARDALRAAARQLEEQYNDGELFPERDEDLKGGNPNLKG
jgi:hypothetical protein